MLIFKTKVVIQNGTEYEKTMMKKMQKKKELKKLIKDERLKSKNYKLKKAEANLTETRKDN